MFDLGSLFPHHRMVLKSPVAMIHVKPLFRYRVHAHALTNQYRLISLDIQLQHSALPLNAMTCPYLAALSDREVIVQVEPGWQEGPSIRWILWCSGKAGVVALYEPAQKGVGVLEGVVTSARCNSFTSRSCKVPHSLSTRPFACGE